MESSRPILSVCMTTYNHEQYIARAIESVLQQQCRFAVEIVVGVDCGADATARVVAEYAERYPSQIVAKIYDERIGMRRNYAETLARCTGHYVAICDGDDWWCDKDKLQRQVDFLDEHSDVAMCFTRSERRSEDGTLSQIYPPADIPDCSFEGMLRLNSAENCTVVARRHLIEQYYGEVEPLQREWLTDDLPMWLWFAAHHRIAFLEGVTAVHTIVEDSVSHSRDYRGRIAFCDSLGDIKLWADEAFHNGRWHGRLLRQRENDALWALARYGTVREYWQRWLSGIMRHWSLWFNTAGYLLIFKRLKYRRR